MANEGRLRHEPNGGRNRNLRAQAFAIAKQASIHNEAASFHCGLSSFHTELSCIGLATVTTSLAKAYE